MKSFVLKRSSKSVPLLIPLLGFIISIMSLVPTSCEGAIGLALKMDKNSPQTQGSVITFTAAASGGSGSYEYYYTFRNPVTGQWAVGQAYSGKQVWKWNTTGLDSGRYTVQAWVRNSGSTASYDAYQGVRYTINPSNTPVVGSDLQQLVENAGNLPKTLSLSAGNWVVPEHLEVPSNIHLKLDYGATIAVASGKTLILHGLLEAPATRIFTGTGSVIFDCDSVQRVYPQWWGAKGDGVTEDTSAIQSAINSFSDKGGELFLQEGTYVVDSVGIKSNITVTGNSSNAILKQKKEARYCISTNLHNAKTNSPMNARNNIKFSNITFQGTVSSDGFSEFMPLLDIRGATNVYISKCNFIGFRGDGVYIGETGTREKAYHNSKIVISECIFDGINKNNRNGVSVIDVDEIVIEKCVFRNTSRPDMPGAIDFEPDDKNNIVRNIRISQNSFENIGGINIIQISITFNLGKLDNPLQNVEIVRNVIEGDGKANGIYVGQPQFADDETPPNNIVISDNLVRNTKRSFMVFGVKDVRMVNNTFEECALDPYISYSEKNINVRDVKITGNTFKNLSKENGNGISIFGVYNLELSGNVFDNIGKADGTSGNALFFRMHGGSADNVTIVNNTFKGSNTKVPIQRDRGQITFPEHNRINGNIFQGDNNVFLPANKL